MFSCVIKPFEGIEAVLKAFLIVRASTSPCAAISSIMACSSVLLCELQFREMRCFFLQRRGYQ